MEKIENNLLTFWKELKKKTVITVNDYNKLEMLLGKTFNKIQRQRERLEKSRDLWKNKFERLVSLK